MRIDFTKNRDDESYYVAEILIDIKTYIESRLHHPKRPDDSGLKKAAEDIIIRSFKKKRFVQARPYIQLKEGQEGENNVLERISSLREILVEIEEQVTVFKLDRDTNTLQTLLPRHIRKLKEEIEKLEMQALAIAENRL